MAWSRVFSLACVGERVNRGGAKNPKQEERGLSVWHKWMREGVVSDCPPSQASVIMESSAVSPCKKIIPAGPADYSHPCKKGYGRSRNPHLSSQLLSTIYCV